MFCQKNSNTMFVFSASLRLCEKIARHLIFNHTLSISRKVAKTQSLNLIVQKPLYLCVFVPLHLPQYLSSSEPQHLKKKAAHTGVEPVSPERQSGRLASNPNEPVPSREQRFRKESNLQPID